MQPLECFFLKNVKVEKRIEFPHLQDNKGYFYFNISLEIFIACKYVLSVELFPNLL